MMASRSKKRGNLPLILLGIGAAAVLGIMVWLSLQANQGRPADGEVRIPVEDALK
jgi:hypothetical protein